MLISTIMRRFVLCAAITLICCTAVSAQLTTDTIPNIGYDMTNNPVSVASNVVNSGQLSGYNDDGTIITNISDLLPLAAQSLFVDGNIDAGEITINGNQALTPVYQYGTTGYNVENPPLSLKFTETKTLNSGKGYGSWLISIIARGNHNAHVAELWYFSVQPQYMGTWTYSLKRLSGDKSHYVIPKEIQCSATDLHLEWKIGSNGNYDDSVGVVVYALNNAHDNIQKGNWDVIDSTQASAGTVVEADYEYASTLNLNGVTITDWSDLFEGSLAIGSSTASGESSFASGNSIATGRYAFAENVARAEGDYSHAEGNSTARGFYSHAEGSSFASGDMAHSEGQYTTASGYASHSEGTGTTASGDQSHAEGAGTQATNQQAHAEGLATLAGGIASHAEGNLTQASGNYSHAEGTITIASGSASHAEGDNTKAIGNDSHAEGVLSEAHGFASHAAGFVAIADHDYTYVWSSGVGDPFTSFHSTTNNQFNVYAHNGIRLITGTNGTVEVGGKLVGDGSALTNLNLTNVGPYGDIPMF